jgi:hypothetical protein
MTAKRTIGSCVQMSGRARRPRRAPHYAPAVMPPPPPVSSTWRDGIFGLAQRELGRVGRAPEQLQLEGSLHGMMGQAHAALDR